MAEGYETDSVVRLETNLDDCPPEVLGAALEKLLAAGALDVWFTPIQMKKNRPAVTLSVLAEMAAADTLTDAIFRETTAFGLRRETITRLKLQRRFEKVATAFGEVTVKLGARGGEILQVAPEYESCRIVAETSGQPVRTIFEVARAAWFAANAPQAAADG